MGYLNLYKYFSPCAYISATTIKQMFALSAADCFRITTPLVCALCHNRISVRSIFTPLLLNLCTMCADSAFILCGLDCK